MMRWIASTLFALLSIPANSVSLQSSELSLKFAAMASLHRGTPFEDRMLSRIFDRHVGDPNVNAIKRRLQETRDEIKVGLTQVLTRLRGCETESWAGDAREFAVRLDHAFEELYETVYRDSLIKLTEEQVMLLEKGLKGLDGEFKTFAEHEDPQSSVLAVCRCRGLIATE